MVSQKANWHTWILHGAGLLVAASAALPLLYLLLRAAGAPPSAWSSLLQPRGLEVVGRSIILAMMTTLSANLIAIPLAWLTARSDLPGRRFWSVLTALPLAMPSYVSAYALVATLGPRGLIRQILGVERAGEIYGFPGAWLVMTLVTYPYVLLTVRAALHGLNPTLEEAARSLGDSPFRAFKHVVLPHLTPSIIAGSLLVILYVLGDFGAVSMLRYTTLTRLIYIQYTSSFNRNSAALLALILVVLTAITLTIAAHFQSRARIYHRVSVTRQLRAVHLGVWRWPALLFCLLIGLAGLGLPLSVMLSWLALGIRGGEAFLYASGPALRSILVSGSAALLALPCALPIALLSVRAPSRFSTLVERMAYTGNALPGIVIALALVFLGVRTPLYQTLIMLVFAYVMRFLPLAVGTLRVSLLQISPRLEEAAHGLGSGPLKVLLSVTLPLMQPGLRSGVALVFLAAMKELPLTLLLAPTGYDTLATRVWSATTEAFYGRAALPALLLMLASALSISLILEQEKK